jgi:mannosyltransferase
VTDNYADQAPDQAVLADPDGDPAAPRAVVVLSVGAIVVGLVLRFVTRSALWLDEALSVNIAKLPLSQIPGALRHDGHPPLYYFLLHGWISLFGTGDVAVRSLSGLFAIAILPLAWLVGRRRGGRRLAWLFTAVMAMSPFVLRYATETRMYAMLMVAVLVLYLLLDDVVRRQRTGWGRLVALAVVTGLMLLTHYWSIWLLGSVELLLLWTWWRHADRRPASLRAFVAIAVGGLAFVPWIPSFLYQAAHTGTPWAGVQRPTNMLGATIQDFGGGAFKDAIAVGAVMTVLVVLGLFGRAIGRFAVELDLRTRRHFRAEAAVAGLTLALGAGVSLVTATTYATRYAAVVYPLVGLLMAAGLACFDDPRVLTGVLACFLALCLLGAYWNVTFPRTQGREAAQAINKVAKTGDVVAFCPDQLGPAFSRSLDARLHLDEVVYPTFGSPLRVDWVDYADRNAAANPQRYATELLARAGDHRIFLVWQGAYRTFGSQCEELLGALGQARPGSQTIVVGGGDRYFEPGSVTVFPPAP